MPTGGFNYAPQAALALEAEAARIIKTAAFKIEWRTKQNLQTMVYSGPNTGRTGALLNANYTMIGGKSGYAAAVAAAQALGNGHVNSDADPIESPLQARVVNAMEYAFYVHDGTRNMPGRPFMRQAAESERVPFERAWQRMHLVPGMGGGTY